MRAAPPALQKVIGDVRRRTRCGLGNSEQAIAPSPGANGRLLCCCFKQIENGVSEMDMLKMKMKIILFKEIKCVVLSRVREQSHTKFAPGRCCRARVPSTSLYPRGDPPKAMRAAQPICSRSRCGRGTNSRIPPLCFVLRNAIV